MLILLIVLIAIAAALTLFALLRGLATFSQEQTAESYTKQTQMMTSRIKWQAIAVILIVVVSFVM
jgi:hypothetical protein